MEKNHLAQKEHQRNLFKALREELKTLLECLRKMRLENAAGDDEIEAPDGWGVIPNHYSMLVQNL